MNPRSVSVYLVTLMIFASIAWFFDSQLIALVVDNPERIKLYELLLKTVPLGVLFATTAYLIVKWFYDGLHRPKYPWQHLELEHFGEIFSLHIKKAEKKLQSTLSTAMKLERIILILLVAASFFCIYGIMAYFGWAIPGGKYLSEWLKNHETSFFAAKASVVLFLFTLLAIKTNQHNNKKKRAELLGDTLRHLRIRGFPSWQVVVTTREEQGKAIRRSQKLIRMLMRVAIKQTEIGIHKKICRGMYWPFGIIKNKKLGPKSAWLYLPDKENKQFFVREIVYPEAGIDPYDGVAQYYFPRMLDVDRWQEKVSFHVKDLKEKYPTDENAAGRKGKENLAQRKESERVKKKELFNQRLVYGSDIGVLWESGLAESIPWIQRWCYMHDAYEEHYPGGEHNGWALKLRSGLILPIMSKIKKDGKKSDRVVPIGLLGIYSPAIAEFDLLVDHEHVCMITDLMSMVFNAMQDMGQGRYFLTPN